MELLKTYDIVVYWFMRLFFFWSSAFTDYKNNAV